METQKKELTMMPLPTVLFMTILVHTMTLLSVFVILMTRLKIVMILVHFLKVGRIGRTREFSALQLICSTNKDLLDKTNFPCYNITILRTNGGMNDEGCYQ